MAIITGPAPRRPSRLLERLRSLPGVGRVGFQARAEAPRRRLALIAHLPRLDRALITAAVSAGVDAVEVLVDGPEDIRALTGFAAQVDVPVGVALASVRGSLEGALSTGIDWIRLPLEAPITVLDWEMPARLLTLPGDLDPRLAGSLNGMQIDAAVLDPGAGGGSGFSLGEALRLRVVIERIKKPLLIQMSAGGAPAAVAASAEHLGCDGVLAPLEGSRPAESLAPLLEALARPAVG